MSTERDVDIAVVGGGITGLLLARMLADVKCGADPVRIAVVEPRPPVPADGELDLRVSALSPASLAALDTAGCLTRLPEYAHCGYDVMRVWQDDTGGEGDHAIRFTAAQVGVPTLGSIVENRAVRSALWELLEEDDQCAFLTTSVSALAMHEDRAELQLEDGVLRARLLVAADGAQSPLREQLGIQCREQAYGENAIVTHLRCEKPHAATAWQKFLPGGPAALLPLADGRVSLVWSHPDDQTDELLALSDEEFAGRLGAALDNVLGQFTCTMPRAAFPLVSAHAERYTGPRFALLGDAAHRIHPLAGQGVNLGIRDVSVLAQEVREFLQRPWADPGDPRMLRRYERARKGDNALTLRAMQGLDGVFRSGLADLAGAGMGMVDRSGLLKSMLARYAIGG